MRETKTVAVPHFEGTRDRDLGKLFLITEWSAARADDWMMRMVFAANKGGGSLPIDLRGIGTEGVAVLFLNTFLRGNISGDELIPLWNELLECAKIVRDASAPDAATDIIEGDIQEVATRQWLRMEVLSLHVNFSIPDALSRLWRLIMTEKKASQDSSSAQMSPAT